MVRDYFNLSKLLQSLVMIVLLLITRESTAWQVIENSTFDAFIEKAESLKDTNAAQAFNFLNKQSHDLSSLSIENQLIFNKLLTELYVEQAQYQQGIKLADEALTLARRLSSPSITTSELLYARGFAIESLGDYQAAREDYIQGLEIADSLNNKKIVAVGLINLGALDYLMEQFDRALIMFNDALAIAQSINDDELSGYIYGEMGILYSLINQEDKSLSYHKKAYEFYVKAGKSLYAINTLRNIASSYSINEKYEAAITVYQQILEHIDEISNNELIASVYSGMAWAHVKQKDSDPEASYQYMLIASQYIEQTEQVDIPIAHALDKGYLFLELGRYQEALNNMHVATEYLKQYEGSEKKVVNTISKLDLLYLKAETYYKIEDFKQAYQAQDEFITFALSLPEKSNVDEIEDLRMRYESEQADLQSKILQQKESVQSLLLSEAQSDVQNRRIFMIIFAIIALILAWILIKIIRGQKKMLLASMRDSLTNVTNRCYLMQLGEELIYHAKDKKLPLSIFILDIDNLKSINNIKGYHRGDLTLKFIAQLGKSHLRENDLFGRLDNDKFVAVLPDTEQASAQKMAEEIRLSLAQQAKLNKDLQEVTISAGVTQYLEINHANFEVLLSAANELRVKAKGLGGNKVFIDD
ncbi:tetratricopeptide repeat-containing diguanylate cyclase [Thalassotalea sp. SU-HH00458]|uniref:GGDEF domain-containing protein n=1 Tax=Thalassotalea sp. SU-HH00458 TaxID=3127657 RepID=UPI0033658BA5